MLVNPDERGIDRAMTIVGDEEIVEPSVEDGILNGHR